MTTSHFLPTCLTLGALALASCRERAMPAPEPEPLEKTEEPVVFVVPAEIGDNAWRYSDWYNAALRSGMSLKEVEALLGPHYTREDEEGAFTLDYIYDDQDPDPPKGAVVGVTLYFEGESLDGWICSIHRELEEGP